MKQEIKILDFNNTSITFWVFIAVCPTYPATKSALDTSVKFPSSIP